MHPIGSLVLLSITSSALADLGVDTTTTAGSAINTNKPSVVRPDIASTTGSEPVDQTGLPGGVAARVESILSWATSAPAAAVNAAPSEIGSHVSSALASLEGEFMSLFGVGAPKSSSTPSVAALASTGHVSITATPAASRPQDTNATVPTTALSAVTPDKPSSSLASSQANAANPSTGLSTANTSPTPAATTISHADASRVMATVGVGALAGVIAMLLV